MRVIVDIEANSLTNVTKIWCVVCKDIDTGKIDIFREITHNEEEKERFLRYASGVTLWIGHNWIGYDWPWLNSLVGLTVSGNIWDVSIDTLIISKLVDYSREGHSIEQYGLELGLEKMEFNDWTKWSQEMEDYCVRDVEICHRIYNAYRHVIDDVNWKPAITLEHRFQIIVNDLHNNGFCFNMGRADLLLDKVGKELDVLDEQILKAFPPREVLIREFTPKLTKFGTISRTSVPRSLWPQIHIYEAGKTYKHTRFDGFNPSSHKQLIEVLNDAGWKPEEKTKSHLVAEREIRLAQSSNHRKDHLLLDDPDIPPVDWANKLEKLAITGWKINEHNLNTLPTTAPLPARLLAKRILLESRRRTLTEWLGLVKEDSRIHGKFLGIGAWTGRMAHQRPNTANIPGEFQLDGKVKLYGKEMRQLWCAPKNRLLVGVDAEGIQLRIFAHYINDKEFTKSLVEGSKDDKTDPHSLNQRVLGSVCKSRAAAKRFIYALLLGGGIAKLSQILECGVPEAKEALDRLLQRYVGFALLRKSRIPTDAKKGGFKGLDGRFVPIPGETERDRQHLCMSGYLQSGEAIVIKKAAVYIDEALKEEKELDHWMFVNIVHDEFQSEVKNSMDIALKVARIQADAIRIAGEELKLKCPLAGSYWNEDHKDYTIGTNWYSTH